MKSVSLNAYPRALARRSGVKKLRSSGRVPAVIYGRHNTPKNLEIDLKELETLIHHSASENVLVDLSVQGDGQGKHLALVQDVQHNVLTGTVLHVDFHEVLENEHVTVTVPVETVGEAIGVKSEGGVLEHVLFKIKVRALPKDLPEVINIDVSELKVGQTIHLSDIKFAAGVEALGDKKISVVSCAMPKAEVVETPAEGAVAATAEPEVLKEKKDEAGAAAAAPAKGGDKGAEKKADKKK